MKRNKSPVFAVLLLCLAQSSALAEDQPWPGTAMDAPPGLGDYLAEIVLRPLGLASNLLGFGMFVAASPITVLASIEKPHDAFVNSFNGFVLGPYRYTFRRPLGQYKFRVNAKESVRLSPQKKGISHMTDQL